MRDHYPRFHSCYYIIIIIIIIITLRRGASLNSLLSDREIGAYSRQDSLPLQTFSRGLYKPVKESFTSYQRCYENACNFMAELDC